MFRGDGEREEAWPEDDRLFSDWYALSGSRRIEGEGMDEGEVGERSSEVAKEESAWMVMAGHVAEEDAGTLKTGDAAGLDLETASTAGRKSARLSDTDGLTASDG